MKNIFEISLAILSAISFFADKWIALFTASHRSLFLDKIFIFVIDYVSIYFFISALLVCIIFRKRKYLKPYLIALSISAILIILIKIIANRARPFIALGIDRIPDISYTFSSWNQSFPSWHAVSFFFMIPFISSKYRPLWFILAAIIAVSRIYSGVHYLSDVLFGALLGYLISKICIDYFK